MELILPELELELNCKDGIDPDSGASVHDKYRNRRVVRPCEENERRTHSEKNARCGHTREKK